MRLYKQSSHTKGRLLLFSGGVDSAGCLSLLNEDDYVITFKTTPTGMWTSFREDMIDKIINVLGLNHTYVDVPYFSLNGKNGPEQQKYRHQLDYQLTYVLGMVRTFPQITEVWYGAWPNLDKEGILKSPGWPLVEEYFDLFSYGFHYERIPPNFRMYYPHKKNVDLLIPLQHISKAKTWNMIPKQCRQYVVSCWSLLNGSDKACGTCNKCLERITSGIPLEPSIEDASI